jgi:excinuclease ABC subunit B
MEHARNLEFEQAARLRDQLSQLREQAFGAAGADNIVPIAPQGAQRGAPQGRQR